MKHIMTLALVAGGLSLCISGCKTSSVNGTTGATSVVAKTTTGKTGQTLAVDSVCYHAKRDTSLEFTAVVDYPRGNDNLAQGVRRFIAGELDSLYLPRDRYDDAAYQRLYPAYAGSLDNGQTLVDFYGNGTMRHLLQERKDMEEYYERTDGYPQIYQKVTIRKDVETASYITYSVCSEEYMGGAHGSYTFYYVNIDKHTCKAVTQLLDAQHVKALQPLLRQGALRYMKECGVTDISLDNLNDYLILPDDGVIPLPKHTPWLVGDTVNFVYQQYEIASYAAGPIAFNIAVSDLKDYFTPEGKALIGKR